jgi:hypothetical protein
MFTRLLSFFSFGKPRQQDGLLFKCWEEMNTNVERFFVVEQRQFITEFFDTQEIQRVIGMPRINLPAEIGAYQQGIEMFNAALKDAKDFEESSYKSAEQKTRANAEVLHQKKEKVEELFKTLRPVMMAAEKTMRVLLNAA